MDRRRWLILFCALVGTAALARAIDAHARAGRALETLLPNDAPSVSAMTELRERFEGAPYLGVVIDAEREANVPAAERMLDDLAARIRRYPDALVRSVHTGRAGERDFLEHNGALFLDLEDLFAIRERIEARHEYEVARATGMLLDDDPPPSVDMGDIERKYRGRIGETNVSSSTRFTRTIDHLTVLLVEPGREVRQAGALRRLVARIDEDVRALGGPERYAPGMHLGYAGEAALAPAVTQAIATDQSLSSMVAILAFFLASAISFSRSGGGRRLAPKIAFGAALVAIAAAIDFAHVPALEKSWDAKFNSIVGASASPIVILADGADDARRIADHLRAHLRGAPFAEAIDRILTIDDVLPSKQSEKIAATRQIDRALTAKMRAHMSESERASAARFLAPDLRPLALADLPESFLAGLVEHDGSAGRAIVVHPSLEKSLDAEAVAALVDGLRTSAAEAIPDRPPPRVAGALPIASDALHQVRRESAIATTLLFVLLALALGAVPALRSREDRLAMTEDRRGGARCAA